MSNLAVVFWSAFDEAVRKGPQIWPALVREIGTATSYEEGDFTWTIMTCTEYRAYREAHQADYDEWEASQPPHPIPVIMHTIRDSKVFGQRMQEYFAAGNVATGITIQEVQAMVSALTPVIYLLNSGSIATALSYIRTYITPSGVITQERIDDFAQRLQDYLDGKPCCFE